MNKPDRALQVGALLRLVGGFDMRNAHNAQVEIHFGIQRMLHEFPNHNAARRRYILGRFDKFLANETCPRRRILALSLVHALTGSYAYLVPIFKLARTLEAPVHEAYGLMHAISDCFFRFQHRFSERQLVKGDRQLRLLYRQILNRICREISAKDVLQVAREPDDNRVMIILTQFLGDRHAPTAMSLRVGRTLVEQFGKELMIYNASLFPRSIHWCFFMPHTGNFIKEYDNIDSIDLGGGAHARLYQNPKTLLDLSWFADLARHIRDFRPGCVISIGQGNLLADCLREIVPVVAWPSTVNLPVSEPGRYTTVQALTPLRQRALRGLGITTDDVALIPVAFGLPTSGEPMERTALGLSPDDFVIAMVGNRFNSEITPAVADMMVRIKQAVPPVKFVLAGKFDEFDDWIEHHVALKDCVLFTGFQTDLPSFLSVADIYLNPPRQGGGTSAAYALAKKIPVITFEGGDVASVTGPDFTVACAGDAVTKVARLAGDPDHMAGCRELSGARWTEISDMTQMTSALLAAAQTKPLPR